ncbi:hypothetical protein V5O48_015059 [Marasmius crinis-equi]|uniref:Uncharacterized protein n=1 Tax=Marasmius crinis-equi TaxID=585013 RepID=A0ABR3EVL5_9AGAR
MASSPNHENVEEFVQGSSSSSHTVPNQHPDPSAHLLEGFESVFSLGSLLTVGQWALTVDRHFETVFEDVLEDVRAFWEADEALRVRFPRWRTLENRLYDRFVQLRFRFDHCPAVLRPVEDMSKDNLRSLVLSWHSAIVDNREERDFGAEYVPRSFLPFLPNRPAFIEVFSMNPDIIQLHGVGPETDEMNVLKSEERDLAIPRLQLSPEDLGGSKETAIGYDTADEMDPNSDQNTCFPNLVRPRRRGTVRPSHINLSRNPFDVSFLPGRDMPFGMDFPLRLDVLPESRYYILTSGYFLSLRFARRLLLLATSVVNSTTSVGQNDRARWWWEEVLPTFVKGTYQLAITKVTQKVREKKFKARARSLQGNVNDFLERHICGGVEERGFREVEYWTERYSDDGGRRYQRMLDQPTRPQAGPVRQEEDANAEFEEMPPSTLKKNWPRKLSRSKAKAPISPERSAEPDQLPPPPITIRIPPSTQVVRSTDREDDLARARDERHRARSGPQEPSSVRSPNEGVSYEDGVQDTLVRIGQSIRRVLNWARGSIEATRGSRRWVGRSVFDGVLMLPPPLTSSTPPPDVSEATSRLGERVPLFLPSESPVPRSPKLPSPVPMSPNPPGPMGIDSPSLLTPAGPVGVNNPDPSSQEVPVSRSQSPSLNPAGSMEEYMSTPVAGGTPALVETPETSTGVEELRDFVQSNHGCDASNPNLLFQPELQYPYPTPDDQSYIGGPSTSLNVQAGSSSILSLLTMEHHPFHPSAATQTVPEVTLPSADQERILELERQLLDSLCSTQEQLSNTHQAPSRDFLWSGRVEIRAGDIPRMISMADRAYHAAAGPILEVLSAMSRSHRSDFVCWEQRVRDGEMTGPDFASRVLVHSNSMQTFLMQAETAHESILPASYRLEGWSFLRAHGSQVPHAITRMWPYTQPLWNSSMVDSSEGIMKANPSKKSLGKRKASDDRGEGSSEDPNKHCK